MRKKALLAKIKKLEGDYSGELESIRKELTGVQLAGTNLERNLTILGEVGTLLDQLSTLKKQGVPNGDTRIVQLVDKLKECRERIC